MNKGNIIQVHKDIICLLGKDGWKKLKMRNGSHFQAYEAPEKIGAPHRVLLPLKECLWEEALYSEYAVCLTKAITDLARAYDTDFVQMITEITGTEKAPAIKIGQEKPPRDKDLGG